MIPKSQNSSSRNRTSESSSSESPSHSAYLDSSSEEEKPVLKTRKQDDKKAVHPKKVEKPVSASTSTEPEFKRKKIMNAEPDTESPKKSVRPMPGKPRSRAEESGPSSFTTTRINHDRVEKSASNHSTSSVTSPRSDNVGRAIEAIVQGELDKFKQLVPQYVPADSISSKGYSLLAIARKLEQPDIGRYIERQLIGRAIKAIETTDVEAFKALVPAQVKPNAMSTNRRPLLAIAKYRQQQLNTIIKHLESEIGDDDLPASGTIADAPGAISNVKGENVSVIEFYRKDRDKYQFTNFYEGKPIKIDGVSWKTAEHYFQAQKFVGEFVKLQEVVRKMETAREALNFATAHELNWRPDWRKVNVNVMRTILAAKFTQDKELRKLLCKTGDAELVEASPIDPFWGYGHDGKGDNMLGKLLMELRSKLQKAL